MMIIYHRKLKCHNARSSLDHFNSHDILASMMMVTVPANNLVATLNFGRNRAFVSG
jgi:hypothetical protein